MLLVAFGVYFCFFRLVVWPTNNNNLKHLLAIHNGTYTKDSQEYDRKDDPCESAAFRMGSYSDSSSSFGLVYFVGRKSKPCKQDITKQKQLIYDRYFIMKSINRRVLYIVEVQRRKKD